MDTPMLGLRTCIYRVADLHKAKTWYTKAFKVAPYFDEPFYVGFNIGGYELGLQPVEASLELGSNIRTYWGVEDIKAVYANLLELGATEAEKPQHVGGPIVVAGVHDPWGNFLGLIYNPTFTLDKKEN